MPPAGHKPSSTSRSNTRNKVASTRYLGSNRPPIGLAPPLLCAAAAICSPVAALALLSTRREKRDKAPRVAAAHLPPFLPSCAADGGEQSGRETWRHLKIYIIHVKPKSCKIMEIENKVDDLHSGSGPCRPDFSSPNAAAACPPFALHCPREPRIGAGAAHSAELTPTLSEAQI